MLAAPLVSIDLIPNRKSRTMKNISKRQSIASYNTMSNNSSSSTNHHSKNHLSISAIPRKQSNGTSQLSKKRPRSSTTVVNAPEISDSLHPTDYVKAAFRSNGFHDFEDITSNCEARVLPVTKAMTDAYQTEILQAVRCTDLEKVQRLYQEGCLPHGCNACNRFGESILHIACRRGHLGMVRFLVEDVGLSIISIRDDYERTPLHDAFWTSNASYDVVDYLLQQPHVSELLLCKDKRGFTPMDYSRGEDRQQWLEFLGERIGQLKPWENPSVVTATVTKEEPPVSPKRQRIIG